MSPEEVTKDGFLLFKARHSMNGLPTLRETDIQPEHGWLEDDFAFGRAYFQLLLYVSFREDSLLHIPI